MATATFDRDDWAKWYAKRHREVDEGVERILYLKEGAQPNEIRLLEVNSLLTESISDDLEPIEFGVDTGTESEHTLLVLDVTPKQWKRIESGKLSLPPGWSLEGHKELAKKKSTS